MKSITLQIKVGLCRGSQSLVLVSRQLLLEVCEKTFKSIFLIDDFVAGRYAVFGGGIIGSLWEYMSPCVCIYFVLLFLSSTLDVGNDVTPSTAVDIWDSVTNTWSLVNMSVARYHAAAAPFGDTSVLFIGVIERLFFLSSENFFPGGQTAGEDEVTASVEMYNIETQTWSSMPDLIQARGQLAATAVRSNAVLAVGGYVGDATV